ncbi:MAG: hypothetical protein M2R45_00897 [Verrucomicrobia subdivision 3 bacterium]|nr:hypothetical protein [Limisphaerales bacterium]MCS1414565.1 hypothetical protein [Limisphaerales bacterium]
MVKKSGQYEMLKRFKIKEKFLVQVVEGSARKKPFIEAFDAFGGRWYGKRDEMELDYHWHPTILFASRSRVDGFHDVFVIAGQFAWVGDGFGWNVIASTGAEAENAFVLGTVYHVEGGDPARVRLHRPYVGRRKLFG